jgi:hypothetical protein
MAGRTWRWAIIGPWNHGDHRCHCLISELEDRGIFVIRGPCAREEGVLRDPEGRELSEFFLLRILERLETSVPWVAVMQRI